MRNYKDVQVWEKAHRLTLAVLQRHARLSERGAIWVDESDPSLIRFDRGTLAEGCGRRSDGEMARYIQISMGSGAELSYHLLLARDLVFLKNTEYSDWDSASSEVMRMLSSLSQKLRNALAR